MVAAVLEISVYFKIMGKNTVCVKRSWFRALVNLNRFVSDVNVGRMFKNLEVLVWNCPWYHRLCSISGSYLLLPAVGPRQCQPKSPPISQTPPRGRYSSTETHYFHCVSWARALQVQSRL